MCESARAETQLLQRELLIVIHIHKYIEYILPDGLLYVQHCCQRFQYDTVLCSTSCSLQSSVFCTLIFSSFPPFLHSYTPPLLLSTSLFPFPSPTPTLSLPFPLLYLCPSFPLSCTIHFCLSLFSVVYLCHMLFSTVLPCLMPVGLGLWMLHLLLCVSRAHSPLLRQLCWGGLRHSH